MDSGKLRKLEARVARAAEAALSGQGYASAIDVLTGIGWLHPSQVKAWRTGQVPYLEREVQADPPRIAEAMRLFRDWASRRGLLRSETSYVGRTPGRQELRFSQGGEPPVELAYRTHFVSPELSEAKRRLLERKANEPPELVVVDPLGHDWKCHRCGGSGGFLIMEPPGPTCLGCARLDALVFLAAGDAALTRLARAKSRTSAVVVRFSRARRRYERQGLLVEAQALRDAERELGRPPATEQPDER